MFGQNRQDSISRISSAGSSSSRYRVHSAPPIAADERFNQRKLVGRKLPPLISNYNPLEMRDIKFKIEKPSTPDPEKVKMVLEQRISQALAGPSCKLNKRQSNDEKCEHTMRRGSLIRSAAIGSEEMQFVPIPVDEMEMLKSINRSQYSTMSRQESSTSNFEELEKHEYEDRSSEDEISEHYQDLKNRRKTSMIRQQEQEDIDASLEGVRLSSIHQRSSRRKNFEDRFSGQRHEKMRSTAKSSDTLDDQINGLVYDIDFDCYYNPKNDTYYRLKSQSKSGEDSHFLPTEIL